jgi:hypothetical protein
MRELLRLTSGADPAAVWLVTTDADTLVPPDWLRRQLDYAGAGWDGWRVRGPEKCVRAGCG